MDAMRVFIAVDIEDPVILSRLESLKEAVVATGVPMKPVETENLHITIRFIGEVPRGLVDEIRGEVLGPLRFKPFEMELVGLGAFPSRQRPRVVWVGVGRGSEELRAIRDRIEAGLRGLGLRPERQEFHPHVTLARIKGSRNIGSLARLLSEYEGYEVGVVRVDSIRLKKSTLTRKGPIYETIAEVRGVENP